MMHFNIIYSNYFPYIDIAFTLTVYNCNFTNHFAWEVKGLKDPMKSVLMKTEGDFGE